MPSAAVPAAEGILCFVFPHPKSARVPFPDMRGSATAGIAGLTAVGRGDAVWTQTRSDAIKKITGIRRSHRIPVILFYSCLTDGTAVMF